MNVYVESSAILCWLLDEARAPEVRGLLGDAELVLTSSLTLIECERVRRSAEQMGFHILPGDAA